MKVLIDRAIIERVLEACEQRLPLVGQASIIDELNALRTALAQEQAELTDEYRKGFIAGQIDMRDREQSDPVLEPVNTPLENALQKAYYYTEEGQWRGAYTREWDRWHAVAKAAIALTQRAAPSRHKE